MSQARLEREVRSSSRFAGVTRVGFRVVIVAGIAGAAWAMSASTAHAATAPAAAVSASDLAGAPLSAIGSSAHPVSGLLTQILAPANQLLTVLAPSTTVPSHIGTGTAPAGASHTSGPRHAAGTISAITSPNDASAPIAIQASGDAAVRPHGADLTAEADAGSPDLVRTVTDLVAPLGLDRILQPTLTEVQPMIGVIDPLTAPLDQLLSSVVIGVVDDVATPIFDALGPVIGPVAGVETRSTDGVGDVAGSSIAPVLAPITPMTSVVAVQGGSPVRVDGASSVKRAIDRHGTRGAPARRSHPLGADRHNTPVSPVPLPALPAPSLGGASTMASGPHGGNGGPATVSVPGRGDAAAVQRSTKSAGITVRRLLVENPIVSPD